MLQPAETLQSIAVSSVIAARNGQHRLDDALEESLPGPTGPTGPTGPGPQPVEPRPKREQRGQLQPSDVKLLGMEMYGGHRTNVNQPGRT